MPSRNLSLALLAVLIGLGSGSAGCATRSEASFHSNWSQHMQTAVAAFEEGDGERGVAHFQQALDQARENPGNPHELAYAAWHLGDVCFKHPSLCEAGDDERRTLESLRVFEIHYGPEHPVVIPVLLRVADIRAGRGDETSARGLREKADRITARAFPPSHYMRAQMGTHRPASDLHPQELLRILADLDLLDG